MSDESKEEEEEEEMSTLAKCMDIEREMGVIPHFFFYWSSIVDFPVDVIV